MAMRVALVRHGDVQDPAVYTTGLTEKGVGQITELCRQLKGFKGSIYTSPYRRCAQSANLMSNLLGLPVYNIDTLGEVGYRKNETVAEAQARGVSAFKQLSKNGRDMILVTHGGLLQGIALHLGHPDGVCDRGQMIVLDL